MADAVILTCAKCGQAKQDVKTYVIPLPLDATYTVQLCKGDAAAYPKQLPPQKK